MDKISPKNKEAHISTTAPASKRYINPHDSKLKYINVNSEKTEPKDIRLKEKSLQEMGYTANEVKDWDSIMQPPKEELQQLLAAMIDEHIKPNVQVRVGQITFNCHMMVLQCYSQFFMECDNELLIALPEDKVTSNAFMKVYTWMTSSQPLVQREGILELFSAACFLRINDLINQIWTCLDNDACFREDTAFLLYLEAHKYGLEDVEYLMLIRICKFFLTLVATKEFLTLTIKQVCGLLSSNNIGVNSEIEIFMSAVRWLNHNWPERECHILDVAKCVRFNLIPQWFLVTLKKNTGCDEVDRLIGNRTVRKMISDGINYTSLELYYSENPKEYLRLLEHFQLKVPKQRQWVFGNKCKYHYSIDCPDKKSINYNSFLKYLQMIRTLDKNHWRSLEMDRSAEKSICPTVTKSKV